MGPNQERPSMLRTSRWFASAALALATFIAACTEVTSSSNNGAVGLRFGKTSVTGPIVTATVPAQAALDTTVDVQVSGSGFDAGSQADFVLNGVEVQGVKTNFTRFVSSASLIANVTV